MYIYMYVCVAVSLVFAVRYFIWLLLGLRSTDGFQQRAFGDADED